jgi:hypothetical protein
VHVVRGPGQLSRRRCPSSSAAAAPSPPRSGKSASSSPAGAAVAAHLALGVRGRLLEAPHGRAEGGGRGDAVMRGVHLRIEG